MRTLFFKKIKDWNDRFGWLLSIVALPSLLSDLAWWSALFKYMLSIVPQWLFSTLIFIRNFIKPILDAYEYIVVYLFSILPFEVPKWLSISLPPLLSLIVASLMAYSIYKRAKTARKYLDMMEDPRFVKTSVVWGLIENTNISLPHKNSYSPRQENELIESIKPQVSQLERNMAIRLFVLNGLIAIYVLVILIELVYRLAV